MEVDLRKHPGIRDAVHAGISALRVQGRQIWGGDKHLLSEITTRLMVGVGDVARLCRDGYGVHSHATPSEDAASKKAWERELKKELGNVVFSTIRWIDDLGFDAIECLELAIAAQEKFAKSGRPR